MENVDGIIKTVGRMAFPGKDSISDADKQAKSRASYDYILGLLAQGNINDAENYLFEILKPEDRSNLKLGLWFYDQINGWDDDQLEASDYSRDEIKDGIHRVAKMFGFSSIVETLM